jgi:hypothetical protein
VIHLYSEFLQRFRLAAQGKGFQGNSRRNGCGSASRPISTRCPSITTPLEAQATDKHAYPLAR